MPQSKISIPDLGRIVPVIRSADRATAATTGDWLTEAGFKALEFTLTTPGALDLIAEHAGSSGPIVGAGTILSSKDAEAAIAAGARFVVTPCWVEGVMECCRAAGITAMIGATTPSEILRAHLAGAEVVKVFPCGPLGGPAYLRQVRAVFPRIAMMPTGGVKPDNARDYLDAGAVAVGIGSELAPLDLIRRGDRETVVALGRRALSLVGDAVGPP